MTDVGDAIEVTFNAPTDADVTVNWFDPAGTAVFSNVGVAENPPASGKYPITLLGQSPGVWTAQFTASGTVTAVETFYQTFEDPSGPTPLASVGDYTDLYGVLSAAKQAVAKALLRRASQLVRDRYPTIDADILAGTVAANTVAMAVINMVARVMRNPQGLRSESVGPFSRSYDMAAASGLLELTAAETGLINPDPKATLAKVRVGTIRVRAGLLPQRFGGWW